jgi:ABC-type transporter Mla subunit MlaD
MKIRRFNENEEVNISSDRIDEIVDELKTFADEIKDKSVYVESLLNELDNYKSKSTSSNDQIDDSISALQIIKSDLDDDFYKIDTIVNNLLNYKDDGRNFMYSENK